MSDTTPETPTACPRCKGDGSTIEPAPFPIEEMEATTCPKCNGTGRAAATPPAGQNGERYVSKGFLDDDIKHLASQLAQAHRTIESVQAEYQSVVLKDGEDIKRLERELTDMEKDKHVIQHERDEYYAELEQTKQQLAQAQGESNRLREIISACVDSLGSGKVSKDASLEFMASVPREIEIVVRELRAGREINNSTK